MKAKELSLPLDIESERWARIARGLTKLIFLAVATIFTIAAVAPVREVAVAPGHISTLQPAMLVEHLDGGVVEQLIAREGDLLDIGSPILVLSRGNIEADLAQVRARQAHHLLQRSRLIAHVEAREPEFGPAGTSYPDLAAEQLAVFAAEAAAIHAERQALGAEISERSLELEASQREMHGLSARIKITEQQLATRESLLESRLTTRGAVYESFSDLERLRSEFAAAERTKFAARRAIADARRAAQVRNAERLQEWVAEISEHSAAIAELEESKKQQQDRLQRVNVSAPAPGILHRLEVAGTGEVLGSGDLVATIIPTGGVLLVEVQVDPKDIGFIEVGSPATITVTSFERELLGQLEGLVTYISPTTIEERDKKPYYKIKLSLIENATDEKTQSRKLLPGMIVTAEIRTGQKSILRYMLKPLIRAMNRAFTER